MVSAAISMKRVLVLSSDPQICHAAASALRDRYSVYATACSRDDVPKFITRMAPQLVICDASLIKVAASAARLAGVGQGQAGTANSTTVDLPNASPVRLLALLSREENRRALEMFDAGAEDYVSTPILANELLSKVDGIFPEDESDEAIDGGPSLDAGEHTRALTRNEPEVSLPPPLSNLDHKGQSKLSLPRTIGRYELEELIGQGGYGVVYRAYDREANRTVALKMLPREANEQPEAVARFYRESAAVGKLNHPNIVRFFDFDSHDGRFYFTMEMLKGDDVKDLADREAPFEIHRAANMVIQVARALQAISSLGFVHRDIKPENMILMADGTIKLIDFGLVKMGDAATITCDNDVLGTPYYMGPEYIAGGTALDAKYDIYSLGVTFYVLLTGQYPFSGRNSAHVLERHLRERPPQVRLLNSAVPEAVDKLIQRMMAKRPANRPSARELIEELVSILGHRVLLPAV